MPAALALLLAALLAAFSPAHAAAYATGGNGLYKNQILWLTWGGGSVNGTANVALNNGDSTSASLTIGGQLLVVTCSLANLTHLWGNTNGLSSYAPGEWSGDGLDNLYNIGGSDRSNVLVNGITNTAATAGYTVDVNCIATLSGTVFKIPGVVVADAEQSRSGEAIQGRADGAWNIMEETEAGTCVGNPYDGILSADSKTLRLAGDASVGGDCPNAGNAANYGPAGVGFLTFNPSAYSGPSAQVSMNFEIDGGGKSAVAIGLLVPNADFGDAPDSYGVAGHLFAPALTPDGLSPGTTVNILGAGFKNSTLTSPPSGTLGKLEDADGNVQLGNAAANIDDSTGINDDDGVNVGTLPPLYANGGQAYTLPVTCQGTGFVKGWIDFKGLGDFSDPAASSNTVNCAGGSASLTFTVPVGTLGGTSYLRVRTASLASEIANPSGIAISGEVEDYLLSITSRPPTVTKAYSPTTITDDGMMISTLTISLGNTLPTPETLLATLDDDIGANLSILNVTGGSCNAASTSFTGTVIHYASGAVLPAGGCTIVAHLSSTTAGVYPNVIPAGALQTTGGSNAAPASATLTVVAPALTLSKSGPAYAVPSTSSTPTTLNYLLTVKNTSAAGASVHSVSVTDTLPAGLSATAISGSGWTCALATLTCTRSDTLAAGGSFPAITVSVTAPQDSALDTTPALRNFTNSAALTGGSTPNTATATTSMIYLKLNKQVRNVTQNTAFGDTNTGSPKDVLEYCIDFANNGGAALANMLIADNVPANTTVLPNAYDAVSSVGGSGIKLIRVATTYQTSAPDADAGSLTPSGGSNNAGIMNTSLGTLAVNASGTACFQVKIQ